MRAHAFLAGLVAVVTALGAADAALAEASGRHRILFNDNRPPVVGEIIREEADAYVVKAGIATMRIPKTQVSRLVPLEDEAAAPTGMPGRLSIRPEEIEAILGSMVLELSALEEEDTIDLDAELPLDEESLDDMMRIAGRKARHFETPHFVFVYTSEPAQARELAGRLERVYRWCVTYVNHLKIRKRLPRAKLEIFYFGTFDEYRAYQTLNGFMMSNALGFYMRTNNRSAFFDMNTWPPLVDLLNQANDPNRSPDDRLRIRTRVDRWSHWMNLEVVQHEAAHHMHFNMGIFPRFGDLPRWMTEGLATMFETPPSGAGASLGTVNHHRLLEFRERYGTEAERIPWEFVREMIIADADPTGYEAYVMGWALNHYLWHEHREKYGEWLRELGERESDFSIRLTRTEQQQRFEDIFGKVDEEWVRTFVRYILSIPARPSERVEAPFRP